LTKLRTYFLLVAFAATIGVHAQTVSDANNRVINIDSAMRQPVKTDRKADSAMRKYSPRTAAIRSAILPGLGQIYNRKYWKVPIVYAAIGIPTYIFFYNLTWYQRTRYAYKVLALHDTDNIPNIHPKLQGYVQYNNLTGLQALRNEFRRDVDYSALFIIIMWGLNVVDATVDAHLKSFDVSPDLSFRFKAGYSELAGTNGVSLVMSIR
jgi:hypothetical protein